MNIEDMILNGASQEEINKALAQVYAEKTKREEASAKARDKEALKTEARAYAINALLAYIEAFDLLPKDETLDAEDIGELEQLLIKIENMIPLYFKLFQMQNDLEEGLGFGFGGLFK